MFRRSLLSLVAVLTLSACASNTPPSNFYILNSLYTASADATVTPDPQGLVIGFGPVTIPDHLDRPQIVTRPSPNRIDIDEFQRWGGELKSNLERVMALNLSYLLNTDRIHVYPWSTRIEVAYQVQVDLVQLDGEPGKQASVGARWRILEGEDGPELASHYSRYREQLSAPGYGPLVAAESRALQRIAGDIKARIDKLEQSKRRRLP